MATTLDINLDKAGGIIKGGACPFGTFPKLTRNDEYIVRLRVLERNSTGAYTDAVLTSPSFKIGIGSLGDVPTTGQFKLTIGATTSSAISYNATTTQFLNAISAIAGNVDVQIYGNSGSGWLVTAATANTALSFGGVDYTLFPTSSVLVNTRRTPATDIKAQQVIELSRNPAVYSDTFTTTSGDTLTLTKKQDGSSTQNEVYELTVGNDVLGGSFSLAFNGYSIAADVGVTAVSLNQSLNTITGIGFPNIEVISNSKRGFVFTFVNQLGLTNIATALILDSTGIVSPNYYQTTITLNTVQLDEIFVENNADTITPTLEIAITDDNKAKTLFQGNVTVQKDLIGTSGGAVPSPQSAYYTKSQVDAGFVPNISSNVNSTARSLNDSSSILSLSYGSRTLNNNSGTQVVSYGTGIAFANTPMGFFGSSITAKPSGTNIVSGLTNLGLLSYTTPTALNVVSALEQTGIFTNNTSTFGVFPQSPRTVTTLTSVTFGTVGANDQHYRDVTINDAAVNDIVLIGLPAAVSAGAVIQGVVYKANTVCLSCVNADSVSRDVNAATYRITVIGY